MDSVGTELSAAERDRSTSAEKIRSLDEALAQTKAALEQAVRACKLRCRESHHVSRHRQCRHRAAHV